MSEPTRHSADQSHLLGVDEEFDPLPCAPGQNPWERPREPAGISDGARILATFGKHALVRYRLRSYRLAEMADAVGCLPTPLNASNRRHAVFAIVGPDGQPDVMIETSQDNTLPHSLIRMMFIRAGATPPGEVIGGALNFIGFAPSRNSGVGPLLAERFDLWRDADTGKWEQKPARVFVKVKFVRHCFVTRPVLSETIELLVPKDPAHELVSNDHEAAHRAESFYRNAAFAELQRLRGGEVRPGFSSWLNDGSPSTVKVISSGLENEIARLTKTATPETEAPNDESDASPSP